MPLCPRCTGAAVKKDGKVGETQRYRCHACRRTFVARTGTPFAGHRWPREVIVTAVRGYCRFRLSAADVRDLLAERGVAGSARTVLTWVQNFAPLLARAGRRAATRPGTRWWCDETYLRVGGPRAYLDRAIDEPGQVVAVLLRARRDLASARAVQRGQVAAPGAGVGGDTGPHARARAAATTFAWLADGLRIAA